MVRDPRELGNVCENWLNGTLAEWSQAAATQPVAAECSPGELKEGATLDLLCSAKKTCETDLATNSAKSHTALVQRAKTLRC